MNPTWILMLPLFFWPQIVWQAAFEAEIARRVE